MFGMKDVMLYASVCVSIDASVEHAFNKVKTKANYAKQTKQKK